MNISLPKVSVPYRLYFIVKVLKYKRYFFSLQFLHPVFKTESHLHISNSKGGCEWALLVDVVLPKEHPPAPRSPCFRDTLFCRLPPTWQSSLALGLSLVLQPTPLHHFLKSYLKILVFWYLDSTQVYPIFNLLSFSHKKSKKSWSLQVSSESLSSSRCQDTQPH